MAIITKLATLDRFKRRLGTTETSEDQQLNELLDVATAVAVDLAGVEFRRDDAVTVYPWDVPDRGSFLYLPNYPIESIDSVKQVYRVPEGNDWTVVDPLVEYTDYLVVDPGAGKASNSGILRRINSMWFRKPGMIQVVGTFGYADPANVPEGAIAPPEELQEGIINEAIQRWTYRNTGGTGDVELPGGGGYRSNGLKPHRNLVAAVKKLKRWRV